MLIASVIAEKLKLEMREILKRGREEKVDSKGNRAPRKRVDLSELPYKFCRNFTELYSTH